ncbi:MAG: sigma-E processing peptidase SpoIIGA [Defluviitaleaceae bacterium]|nr:sigma-E processing peptidase SpoIIGA [Defluviitaleaceae bacterium]
MHIYADVVFAINLIMNAFILWIAAKLRSRYVPPWRILCAGAVMSGLYCLLMFVARLRPFMNIFAAVFIIALGIVVCFRPRDVRELAILTGLAHVAAFALGGIGMALFYFTNIGDMLGNMLTVSYRNFSVHLLLASSCIFYILIRLFARWSNSLAVKKQALYPVKISCGGDDISLTALVDTGNSLRDPISKSPVMIAEFNAVKHFLPDSLKLIFYEKKEDDLDAWVNVLDDGFAGRVRMIPFAGLGIQNGLLFGFRPDKVEVMNDNKTDIFNDVVVGISNFSLSHEGKYQGLLSPELIT